MLFSQWARASRGDFALRLELEDTRQRRHFEHFANAFVRRRQPHVAALIAGDPERGDEPGKAGGLERADAVEIDRDVDATCTDGGRDGFLDDLRALGVEITDQFHGCAARSRCRMVFDLYSHLEYSTL